MPTAGAKIVLTIPTDLYDRLAARSRATGLPVRTLHRQAIEAKLDRDEIAGASPAMKEAAE